MNGGAGEPWRQVGTNVFVRLEPPDLFVSRIEGQLSAPDLAAVFAEVKRLTAERGPLFWLVDVSRLTMVSPEARKLAAVEAPSLSVHGISAFGAGFHHRVVTTLVATAMRSLYPSLQKLAIPAFHTTEAEARAWLAKRRDEQARIPR